MTDLEPEYMFKRRGRRPTRCTVTGVCDLKKRQIRIRTCAYGENYPELFIRVLCHEINHWYQLCPENAWRQYKRSNKKGRALMEAIADWGVR